MMSDNSLNKGYSDTIPVEKNSGFVARLFHGDVSLPVTYWIFGVLIGNVGTRIISTVIEFNYLELISTPTGVWSVNAFYLIATGYSVFIFIAVWRSAAKYRGRKLWSGLARVGVVIGAFIFAAGFMSGIQQGENNGLALSEEIEILNKSLPSMVDDETRLDRVLIQGRDLHYNYTLVNWLSADIDIDNLIVKTAPHIKTTQCNDDYARGLIDDGRKLVYSYRDKVGKPITKIQIDKSDCF
jgi:hypothetical protein